MINKAQQVMANVIDSIMNSNEVLPKFIKHKVFSENINIPCLSWSFSNQFIVFMSNTSDARGIKQWNKVGRTVNKGARAIYIFIPMIFSSSPIKGRGRQSKSRRELIEEENNNDDEQLDDEEKEVHKRVQFRVIPVFRVEDTSGKDLDYEILQRSFDPSSFPLIEIADKLNIPVKMSLIDIYSGAYNVTKNIIYMACDDPQVFLHELSHAVDTRIPGKSTSTSYNEIVAELSSAFLGLLYDVPVDLASTRRYIEHYSGKNNILSKIFEASKRVMEIYSYIESFQKPPLHGQILSPTA
jgi:hypothetical protein